MQEIRKRDCVVLETALLWAASGTAATLAIPDTAHGDEWRWLFLGAKADPLFSNIVQTKKAEYYWQFPIGGKPLTDEAPLLQALRPSMQIPLFKIH